MRIEYGQNPLEAKVFLDDHEKEVYLLKIKLEFMNDYLYELAFDTHHETKRKEKRVPDTIEFARKSIESLDKEAQERFNSYIEELESGASHIGDCICYPMTCWKCLAESTMDINTIPGLRKHMAHYVFHAFEKFETLDEVIAHLESKDYFNWDPEGSYKNDKALWDANVDRWREECNKAIEWLKQYKKDKL